MKTRYMEVPNPQPRQLSCRSERKEDAACIRLIHTTAFGHDWEANLIEELRQENLLDPALSLLGLVNGEVAAHILFTPVSIHNSVRKLPVMLLAPLAVLPQYQGIGVGSLLVREGLRLCKERGLKIVLVYGEAYYARFGFRPAREFNVFRPIVETGDHFWLLELVPEAAVNASGVIEYPKPFYPLVFQNVLAALHLSTLKC